VDKVETIDGSVIQHGRHNDRIYLMHLHGEATAGLISKLDKLAITHGYGKIFAKIPATHWKAFKSADYAREVVIPGFFKGKTDGLFVAKFFSAKRRKANHRIHFSPTGAAYSRDARDTGSTPPVVACTASDTREMADLYQRMFDTYPFPIHQSLHISQMMANHSFYFCIRLKKKIAAVAAAEIDPANQTCEMTDFATLPDCRGNGFAEKLLRQLDQEAHGRGVRTAYTIARADSQAMNRVFEKTGYRYAGRLINNSQIGGRIRSMTVWYKRL
jgi:beta-lysine N6-acetyltransferase